VTATDAIGRLQAGDRDRRFVFVHLLPQLRKALARASAQS